MRGKAGKPLRGCFEISLAVSQLLDFFRVPAITKEMTVPLHRRTLWFAVFAAGLVLSPSRIAAQSGTVTDDAFASSNATTETFNANGEGIAPVVADSSAKVGIMA